MTSDPLPLKKLSGFGKVAKIALGGQSLPSLPPFPRGGVYDNFIQEENGT